MTIFTIAYNEEILIQHFINHYRSKFPGCRIIVFDNYSTDKTREIVRDNEGEVWMYDSHNQIRDDLYLKIKNNCWKWCDDDWVCICDVDELCDINETQLNSEAKAGATVIKFTGWHMVNTSTDPNNINLHLDSGIRDTMYDKCLMFSPKHIKEINYSVGAHGCKIIGKRKYGGHYNCRHLKFIGKNHLIKRYTEFASRLSDENKKLGWGVQYVSDRLAEDYDKHQKMELKKIR